MAIQWLRLWHDMPNDPKWRTIARTAKQPIPCVIAVYLHLLISASMNATERGRTKSVCNEDVASALDMECEQVEAIIDAMQGRVLDGDMIAGWEKRQVEREDGSAARAKAWRETQKVLKETQANAPERKKTPDKDKDKDKEEPSMSGTDVPDDQRADEILVERRKTRRGSDADYECAEYLFKQQRKANSTCKAPNFDTWANDVRLMREQDGRQHRDICELFKWAKADDFWSPNIQSPAKLREKWDQLAERRAKDNPPPEPAKKDWI